MKSIIFKIMVLIAIMPIMMESAYGSNLENTSSLLNGSEQPSAVDFYKEIKGSWQYFMEGNVQHIEGGFSISSAGLNKYFDIGGSCSLDGYCGDWSSILTITGNTIDDGHDLQEVQVTSTPNGMLLKIRNEIYSVNKYFWMGSDASYLATCSKFYDSDKVSVQVAGSGKTDPSEYTMPSASDLAICKNLN